MNDWKYDREAPIFKIESIEFKPYDTPVALIISENNMDKPKRTIGDRLIRLMLEECCATPNGNVNGADSLGCPFCFSEIKIMGHAYSGRSLAGSGISHRDDCVFDAARRYVEAIDQIQ